MAPDKQLRLALSATAAAAVALSMAAAGAQETRPQQQTPVFRGGIDVVPLTVSVVNRSGVPVTGLTRADFTVRENGRPREVLSFFPQVFEPGSVASPSTDSSGLGDRGVAPATRRTFLIVLGNGRIQYPTRALDGAAEFVRERLLPQDAVALIAFHRATSFTTNHDGIAAILERYRETHERIDFGIREYFRRTRGFGRGGPPLPASMLAAIDRDLFDGIALPASGEDPHAITIRNTADLLLGMDVAASIRERPWQQQPTFQGLLQSAERGGFSLIDLTILSSRLKLLAAIEYLRGVEGDRHIVFLARDAIARNADDARVLGARANGARVAVDYVGTAGTSPRGAHGCLSCRDIADLTGGSYTTVDYASRALAGIDQASRSSYLIGYAPVDHAVDGAYREITVTVNRPDVVVRFQKGYVARAEVEPVDLQEMVAESRVTGALMSGFDAKEIGLDIRAAGVVTETGNEVRVDVSLDVRQLALKETGGRHAGRVDVHVYCGDVRQIPVGDRMERLDLEADAATYAAWIETGFRRVVQVPVSSPARYVKVIVYDHGSGRIGSRSVTVGESGTWNLRASIPDSPEASPSGQAAPLQLPQRIARDPARGRRVHPRNAPCFGHCRATQSRVALADLSERPVHGLSDEVARVGCLAPDDRQKAQEHGVGQLLAVNGHAGHQREAGSLDELVPAPGPRARLAFRERRPIETECDRVGERPVVARTNPAIHLA
jgi:VWFA-related protein